MKTIYERDLKGNETGKIGYYSKDGKQLAIYKPAMQIRGKDYKAYISFNSNRLTLDWDKPILDRAKPQYKKEIAEILELYKGLAITEHINI